MKGIKFEDNFTVKDKLANRTLLSPILPILLNSYEHLIAPEAFV